jgi:hypothetical protein
MIILHQLTIILKKLAIILHLPTIIRNPPSIILLPPTIIQHPTTIIHHPPTIILHLTIPIHNSTKAIQTIPTIIRHPTKASIALIQPTRLYSSVIPVLYSHLQSHIHTINNSNVSNLLEQICNLARTDLQSVCSLPFPKSIKSNKPSVQTISPQKKTFNKSLPISI